jgi:hypothetical protein
MLNVKSDANNKVLMISYLKLTRKILSATHARAKRLC